MFHIFMSNISHIYSLVDSFFWYIYGNKIGVDAVVECIFFRFGQIFWVYMAMLNEGMFAMC